ncbi:hypothetical protein A33M_0605 [Rhodovulum sp. PH10]|nr:hypothetical protein A33M_0605 [Rhodovulum sp. PH10]
MIVHGGRPWRGAGRNARGTNGGTGRRRRQRARRAARFGGGPLTA